MSVSKLMYYLLFVLWACFTIGTILIQIDILPREGIDIVFYSLVGLTMTSIKNIQIALKEVE